MEIEMSESLTYSGRKFEFCDIEWVIENFSLAACKTNWNFTTPEFTMKGFRTTRWVMTLTCEPALMDGKEEICLKLGLRRCHSDPGPDLVWVDSRMTMHRPHCDHNPVNKLSCFKKGSPSAEYLGSMESILKALQPFEPDLLVLHFKMIIYSKESNEGFHPCSDIGIRSLSEDLRRLYDEKEYSDLELVFTTGSIKAHKVIACSRLRKLNMLIEREGRKSEKNESGKQWDVVDLSYLNYSAMDSIMKYAYSGDLRYVLENPSLFVYDCLQVFDIPEVKSYYIPRRLHFRSTVNKSEFNFEWVIPDKRNLMSKESVKSPEFADYTTGTIWQLHLVPSDDGDDYCDLQVESMVEKEFVVSIECGLAGKDNRYLLVERVRHSLQALRMYVFNKFLGLNIVRFFPEDKYLTVAVKIRLSSGLTSTYIEKHDVVFFECTPAERCYYLLSAQMDAAYKAKLFSDFHLELNSIPYKMHRSVISARSSKMHESVIQMRVGGANPFLDMEPSIFCMLLRFLYTGVMLESDFEKDFIDLYERAVYFDLPVLKELCSKCLQVQIQNNLVIRAKALKVSEKYNDEVLKESVRKCISEL